MRKLTHTEVHQALDERWGKRDGTTPDGETYRQALFCPYYVSLEGVLGMDWGVIINPDSQKFGDVVFEHDDCGCPDAPHKWSSGEKDAWLDKRAR
jgi:hypothetical protein